MIVRGIALMILFSSWDKLLTASTTSEAVEAASLLTLFDLRGMRLPLPFEELCTNAQKNIKAISRAFEINFGGVRDDGWDPWKEDLKEMDEWDTAIIEIKQKRSRDDDEANPLIVAQNSKAGYMQTQTAFQQGCEHMDVIKNASVANKCPRQLNNTEGQESVTTELNMDVNGNRNKPSSVELKGAEVIRNWALVSSHMDPPVEAIEIVSKSTNPSCVLKYVIPTEATPLIRAAIITSFSDRIGLSLANAVMTVLILPYLESLKAPAPREALAAIVKFGAFHWRSAISMYGYFGKGELKVNGAVAEVLARVASGFTGEGALMALQEYSNCQWGEAGIKVVDALLARTADQESVVNIILPALEKNVIGMEKSVRFGKLLFTVAKEFNNIEKEYKHILESVLARSNVFLAKRALSYLTKKS